MDAVLAVFVIIMSLLILISVLGGSIYPATEKFTSVDPTRILGQPFAMWNDAYKQRVEGFAEDAAEMTDGNNDETVSEVSAQASDSSSPPPPPPTNEPTPSAGDDNVDGGDDGGDVGGDGGGDGVGDTTEEYRDYVAEDYYAYSDDGVAMGMDGSVVEGFPGNMYAAYAPTSDGACGACV
jgi:hypothetical protein